MLDENLECALTFIDICFLDTLDVHTSYVFPNGGRDAYPP